MDWQTVLVGTIPAVASFAAATITVWLGFKYSLVQQKEAKRLEIRVNFLVQVFRDVEAVCARDPAALAERSHAVERAIADIQLFGTPDLVNLAKEFAEAWEGGGGADLQRLGKELRDELRKELGLCPLSSKLFNLRIGKPLTSPGTDPEP